MGGVLHGLLIELEPHAYLVYAPIDLPLKDESN
jgi:hypothetical protein